MYFIVVNIYALCEILFLVAFSTVRRKVKLPSLSMFFNDDPVFAHNSSVELKTTVIQPAS
jgi:hypothetical protein